MARTKGSGRGGGVMLYQLHDKCGKKKAIYNPILGSMVPPFHCISCKERFDSETLIRKTFKIQSK
jgi:hypothetical protein